MLSSYIVINILYSSILSNLKCRYRESSPSVEFLVSMFTSNFGKMEWHRGNKIDNTGKLLVDVPDLELELEVERRETQLVDR